MNILSIETSCDETAISILNALGDFPDAKYEILGNALFSQIDIHREYGGVFPAMAKREHIVTLVPMLKKALGEASLEKSYHPELEDDKTAHIHKMLEREPGLADQLLDYQKENGTPPISLICVTAGPGLEPALWVGVNFAKALATIWNVPVVAVNHMEGHILASVFDGTRIAPVKFPALSLLISGGHTELIKFDDWNQYQRIGQTKDDAVGEAFDKVARILGLPYPGGPEISKLAAGAREAGLKTDKALPRPMIDSGDLDFSFSGLKTAVLYRVKDLELSDDEKMMMAREFEDAATEVLLKKTAKAVATHNIQSLILGGGVTANSFLRKTFTEFFSKEHPEVTLHIPEPKLSTDNSIMIALAGHSRKNEAMTPEESLSIKAEGNRSLTEESL